MACVVVKDMRLFKKMHLEYIESRSGGLASGRVLASRGFVVMREFQFSE